MKKKITISSHYLGKKGADYAHQKLGGSHFGHYLQSRFFQSEIAENNSVLDFGAGNGTIAQFIRCRELFAYEVNPASVEICQKQQLSVVTSLENFSNHFDIVYSNHVLEHVRDPVTTLLQIKEVLKPGGKLLLMLPLEDWRTFHSRTVDPADLDNHLQTWTPRLIANTLQEAGFEVRSSRVITRAWSPGLLPLYRFRWLRPFFMWATAFFFRNRQLWAIGIKGVS